MSENKTGISTPIVLLLGFIVWALCMVVIFGGNMLYAEDATLPFGRTSITDTSEVPDTSSENAEIMLGGSIAGNIKGLLDCSDISEIDIPKIGVALSKMLPSDWSSETSSLTVGESFIEKDTFGREQLHLSIVDETSNTTYSLVKINGEWNVVSVLSGNAAITGGEKPLTSIAQKGEFYGKSSS